MNSIDNYYLQLLHKSFRFADIPLQDKTFDVLFGGNVLRQLALVVAYSIEC